ncbi:MAG TPA: hypothetical protein VFJ74_16005 [Gemmatimonadaceae bacterium]|nr:hypothetical protein [Gemmatimonadaceae bacterium]
MRRSSLCLAVSIAVVSSAACAGHGPPVTTAAGAGAVASGPLQARLYSAFDQTVRFALNRPAYVAVFELVPGQGVSLVYPAPFDDAASKPTSAGFNVAFLAPVDFGRLFYLTSFQGRGREPSYLYLVASEAPLDIERILRDPGALRARLGVAAFSSSFGPKLMDLVDRTVVPEQADDSWTSDYVVLWPDDDSQPPVSVPRFLVQCSDDRLILLDPLADVNKAVIGCRAPRVVATLPRDSTSRPDSSATHRPRPPRSRADEDASPSPGPGDRHRASRTPLAVRYQVDADRTERGRERVSPWLRDRSAPWRDERSRPRDEHSRPRDDARQGEPTTGAPRAEPRRADPPPPPPPPPRAAPTRSATGRE